MFLLNSSITQRWAALQYGLRRDAYGDSRPAPAIGTFGRDFWRVSGSGMLRTWLHDSFRDGFIIVAAELRYGTTKKDSPRLRAQVEAVLGAMDTIPFDSPADEIYGSIRTQLELAGTPIGGNDLLIGAHAMALDHTLVTHNDKEFARIRGLRVENWLRD